MNTSKKLILATFVISTLSLGGLAASASIKNPQTHPIISPQSAKSTSIAEASDGDGEMNDALEAELESKTAPENSSEVKNSNSTQAISEDSDGGDETQEIHNEPHDRDGGDETHEIN